MFRVSAFLSTVRAPVVHLTPSIRIFTATTQTTRRYWKHAVFGVAAATVVTGTVLMSPQFSIDATSLGNTLRWETVVTNGKPPAPRAGHTLTTCGDVIVLVGGADTAGPLLLRDVHIFDPRTNRWIPLRNPAHEDKVPLMASSNHVTVALDNSHLLVIGGAGGYRSLNAHAHILDVNTQSWTFPALTGPAPEGMLGGAGAIHNGAVYMFGGYNSRSRPTSDLAVLRTDTMQWSHVKPTLYRWPSARVGASMVSYKDKLVLFGGYDPVSKEPLNDLHVFDTGMQQWVHVEVSGDVPENRSGHACAVLGNRMIVFGGVRGKDARNDVYSLNLETMVWQQETVSGTAPAPRLGAAMTACNGTVYLFGGSSMDKETFNDLVAIRQG